MARALVCGGRGYTDAARVDKIMDEAVVRLGITEIIQGGAPGADHLAKLWATKRGIPQTEFAADWDHLGKTAGPARNKQMLTEGKPDVVLAFPGGRGTDHMMRIAREAGVKVIEC